MFSLFFRENDTIELNPTTTWFSLTGLQTYFHVSVKKYILLQDLRKCRSLSAYVYHNALSVYSLLFSHLVFYFCTLK